MASEDEETGTTSDELPLGRSILRGTRVDRYELGERIGRGGMGEVVAARDAQIGRDVAIKRLRSEEPSDRQVARFEREARIQGRLEHPAIVPVHELGRDPEGRPYFAMKKLAGTTLAAILDGEVPGELTRQRLLRAFAEVCLAVEYAHVHGVIHRDLKPDNIMLGDYGEVYVLDWGVAKAIGEIDDGFEDLRHEAGTLAGTAIGTPGYMSPEQQLGMADVDGRADVYALGRVLGEILTYHPDAPPELDALCEHAIEHDRERRLDSARELGDRVQRYLDGDRDLALRGKLARDHLELAHAAFKAGDAPAVAMREAGRALALDPHLPGAADLVGRLMLEPPRELPREVEGSLSEGDARVTRATSMAAVIAHVALAAVIPLLVAAGEVEYAFALALAIALNVIPIWLVAAGRMIPSPYVLSLTIVPVTAMIAKLYSPIVAAGMASLTALMLSSHPIHRGWRSLAFVAITQCVAVLAPTIGESAGWTTPTFFVENNGWRFASPGFGGRVSLVVILLGLYVVSMIVVAVITGRFLRRSERALRRTLEVQRWQLAQLVPDATSAG